MRRMEHRWLMEKASQKVRKARAEHLLLSGVHHLRIKRQLRKAAKIIYDVSGVYHQIVANMKRTCPELPDRASNFAF
jgi:hypothetical protein